MPFQLFDKGWLLEENFTHTKFLFFFSSQDNEMEFFILYKKEATIFVWMEFTFIVLDLFFIEQMEMNRHDNVLLL